MLSNQVQRLSTWLYNVVLSIPEAYPLKALVLLITIEMLTGSSAYVVHITEAITGAYILALVCVRAAYM